MYDLVCNDFASELGHGQYAPTKLSRKVLEENDWNNGLTESTLRSCLTPVTIDQFRFKTTDLVSSTFYPSFRKHQDYV